MNGKRVSAKGSARRVMEGTTIESLLGITEEPPVEPTSPPEPIKPTETKEEDKSIDDLKATILELESQLKTAKTEAMETQSRLEDIKNTPVKPLTEEDFDMRRFLAMLKTTASTRTGTSHYVSEEVDAWLDDLKSEFRIFGRAKGPNEAGTLWNMGLILLKEGLSTVPNWREQVRGLAHSPDLALVEMYSLAIKGIKNEL